MITLWWIIIIIHSAFTLDKLSTSPQPNYVNALPVNEDQALDKLNGIQHTREQMENSARTSSTAKKTKRKQLKTLIPKTSPLSKEKESTCNESDSKDD